MTRDEVFERLSELGVGEVQIQYDGGGDESTIEEIALYDVADCPVESDVQPKYILDEPPYNHRDGLPADAHEIAEALLAPLYAEIGDNFGDSVPGVNGRLVWNVSRRLLTLHDNYLEWISEEKSL